VTDLAHPRFLVRAGIGHERVAGVPAALGQLDHRIDGQLQQLAE
jgi:hypothetical protein